jgi:hypothetical protein
VGAAALTPYKVRQEETTHMTEESGAKKPEEQVKDLELNRETLQNLTELQTEQVKGGVRGASDACESSPSGRNCFW